jgi:hypothetical protein
VYWYHKEVPQFFFEYCCGITEKIDVDDWTFTANQQPWKSSLFSGFLILFDLGGLSCENWSPCLCCHLVGTSEGQSTIKILNFTNCSSTIFLKI